MKRKRLNRKAVSRRKKERRELSPLFFDALGIALIALGLILLLSLRLEEGLLSKGCRYLVIAFGDGAYLLPLALFLTGIFALVRWEKSKVGNSALGILLFLFALLTLLHLPSADGDIWGIAREGHGGGYVGGALSFIFQKIVGHYGAYILTLALLLISLLLIIGIPLRELVSHLRRQPKELPAQRVARPIPPPKEPQPKEEAPRIKFSFLRKKKPKEKEEEKPKIEVKAPPSAYQLPPLDLLKKGKGVPERKWEEDAKEHIEIITRTLADFKVEAQVVEISRGPTVTRYEVRLAPGIKVKKIVSLADNLAMELAAKSVRVEAPIPNKSAIGIEVPNKVVSTVYLRELLEKQEFWENRGKLIFPLGLDVAGKPVYADLSAMPHLLIGGATGSGKSVFLSSLVASFLYKFYPEELKFIIIDPKRVELTLYDDIPHLVEPVVKEVADVLTVLHKAIREMERRYDLFAEAGVRNIIGFNQKFPEERLPYLVIVVDELADIMLTKQKAQIEALLCRLAQLARATGIHLVVATQRPSVDIITGLIKANFPSRIAFAVTSQIDSRVILDTGGAELLVGSGDMLFSPLDSPKPIRVQAPYISEKEMESLADFWRKQGAPSPLPDWTSPIEMEGMGEAGGEEDELFEQAVRLVAMLRQASTSMLQRKMKIGYNRAARLIEMMEERGIVAPQEGVRPREVLVTPEEVEEMFSSREE